MIKKLWEKTKEKLETVREQIDGKKAPDIKPTTVKQTESQERLNQLLKSIEEKVFDKKIIRFENRMYLPCVYNMFLSTEHFAKLLDSEKLFLQDALKKAILKQAKDIANGKKLTTRKIKVKIYEDGTLSASEIDVKPSDNLDDTIELGNLSYNQSDKTIETPTGVTVEVDIVDFEPLYYLEVWENEKKVEEFPILKNQVTIGRDTKDNSANIRLKTEDKQISSLHTAIKFKSESDITVEAMHKNITKVGKTVISNGKTDFPTETKLNKNDEIQIFGFKIKLRF
jgi:FHA domain